MKYLTFALLLASTCAYGKGPDDKIWQSWLPKGWKLLQSVTGDLNQDGTNDAVLLLEENNPANKKANQAMGAETLNLNPRSLLILLQSNSGYQKAFSSDSFIPPEHDADTPCLADPLDNGGIHIKAGILKIEFQYWLSCGSYSVSQQSYSFRYENARFRLIGFDRAESMRSTGDRSEYSANLLTGKEKTTTGLNDVEASKPKVKWGKLVDSRPVYFEDIVPCSEKNKVKWCR